MSAAAVTQPGRAFPPTSGRSGQGPAPAAFPGVEPGVAPLPLPIQHGMIFDHFAGGGGASEGIRMALGRCPDAAVNHDPEAVAMHTANHGATVHYCEDVFQVSPRRAIADVEAARPSAAGQPVLLCWMSPDCTHFSKARGGQPVSRQRRGLAWLAVRWAREARPLVILLENVEEFFTWGPLGPDERPDPKKMGVTFGLWKKQLEKLGYEVGWRESRACDYGAPTTRKRLLVQARRDGRPIRWPRPTHADPAELARANAAGGLFGDDRQPWRTAADVVDWSIPCPSIFDRARPLKEATQKRIGAGIKRYVLENSRPFLVRVSNAGGRDGASVDLAQPLPTVTTARGGELALVAPTLVSVAHGDSGGRRSVEIDQPLHTILKKGKHALVAAFMAQHNGGMVGHPMDRPVSTLTLGGCQQQVVAAHLAVLRRNVDHAGMDQPVPTLTAGGTHMAAVAAFMVKYYGEGGQSQEMDQPVHTIPTRDRFGLVTVEIDGVTWVITDIGMRMLTPRELARAMSWPDSYQLAVPGPDGRGLSKSAQVARIGNGVASVWAAAHVRAALYLDEVAA